MAATTNVQIVISAKDQASKVLKGVSSSLSAIGTVAKVGAAAVGVAGAAIVSFGISSIKSANEAEVAVAKFNATLATMGKKGEEAKGKLLEMADAAVQLGFDDETAANSLAKFFKVTGDLTLAQQANAVAMDLARLKGIDLQEASKGVSLALQGNVKALKEYDIKIQEGASATEVFSAISSVAAGQAALFAATTEGKMKILSENIDNAKQKFGETLKDILPVNQALDYFNSLLTPEKIAGYNTELEKIPGYFKSIQDAVSRWRENFFSDTNFVWIFLKDFFVPIFTMLRDTALKTWKDITDAIEPIKPQLTILAKFFGVILLTAIMVVIAVVAGLIKGFMDLVSIIVKTVSKTIQSLTDYFEGLWLKVFNLWDVWKKLTEAMSKPIKAVVNLFKNDKSGDSDGKDFGGGVSSGTSYVVGEHRPEVFVPHQSGNIRQVNQGAVSRDITVNFNNASVRNDQDLDAIVFAVKKTLAREQELIQLGA